ncbi:hypothetical protein HN903_02795 [archaeon]|jgi:hypothetical protein|nr:hypothetical protein [archaeon]MBT6956619.1 hypothetical protein [archaeon]MBT7128661.1 hypothetical protein [archaeon]MBT7484449.1 hypothetical protein [Candidatus Peregrinibacteria bacterium]
MRCYRIRFSDLAVVDERGRKSKVKFPEAMTVAQLFKKHGNLKMIRDGDFLMGGFCKGRSIGKRIGILPDGTKLNKAFPLFASKLAIHDEKSHGHWDVIFENPSGSLCYIYSLDKMKISKDKKFKLVDDFEKCLPRLRRNLMKALGTSELVLAMLVLLKTKMRVGSEVYYKRSRHKGLTTLKKKDIQISGKKVRFSFIGKDGVPQVIEEIFGERVVSELKRVLGKRKMDDFVFLNSKGRPFGDVEFEAGFERFCGERFYPHIVRSHFATREVEKFLAKKNKGNVGVFCLGLAEKLGHKKIVKGEWENSSDVTLHYYVRPDLVERVRKLI